MSLKDKSTEIQRLIDAFEAEAGKFHEIQFHTYLITQDGDPISEQKFMQLNHAITLWQYYGIVDTDKTIDQFFADVNTSNLQWGIRGAKLTLWGVIEGEATPLFVRMAKRAGSLFNKAESYDIKSRVVSEIQDKENAKSTSGKPVAVVNENPLAIWLNFLLYHLSLTNPGREKACRIEPDPFTLSLMALERLAESLMVSKIDRSRTALLDLHFKVAVSFPGEKRRYVSGVVDALRSHLGKDSVFYDYDYQAQLARPNMDILLQKIYRDKSDLIVVFLCAEYAKKQWCGLEWRAIRDIIKLKQDDRVMFVRFDEATIEGLFSIDGYIDGAKLSTKQVAKYILERLESLG